MARPDFKKKWWFRVSALVVVIFAGIQIYWFQLKEGSIIDAMSVLTSLGLAGILIILSNIGCLENKITANLQPVRWDARNLTVSDDIALVECGAIYSLEVEKYFSSIKEELNQVDRLISDAVNNLVINFGYISKLTKVHHEMVWAIEKMAVTEDNKSIFHLLEKQIVTADKIEQELESAITSLQFGDLVTQLLAHTVSQVEILNLTLQRVEREGNCQDGRKKLCVLQTSVSNALVTANVGKKRKPVVQEGMQMGEVELF